ncbi:MAG: UDP-N-acetylglucosamine--N-acetylmuramyl-(pentapeptide) pyrophosphoryl-undecaprenol N-acetylglucosamine transferase [Candidatus Sericytochromatia bacterium]|nr:UDP-N-acetylglucosamine--N-acetylmuramyl-(pentapeptide) pyrophosphoryl-undecaprenol N-acetylglucosamine transferase [Candidatus Sericytochromatia bacterium]
MILLSAGGTGGHLYPALAVAEAIEALAPGTPVHVVGTADHLEARVVPAAGLPFHAVPAAPFPRRPDGRALRFLQAFPAGIIASMQLLGRLRPRVVAGFGAYLTVPPLLAAAARGLPIVLHEANAHPGKANSLLARWASSILVSHEEAAAAFPNKPVKVTGTPLRASFLPAASPEGRAQARARFGIGIEERLLVITGGSLGARLLNDAVARHRTEWLSRTQWRLVHLTGQAQLKDVLDALPDADRLEDWHGGEAWSSASGRLVTAPYCDSMADLLSASDLVVSRSGATTVAEMALLGRPGVMVPLALNPDQAANAAAMARAGGGRVVTQDHVIDELCPVVCALMDNEEERVGMGRCAATLGHPDAARAVASELLDWAASSMTRT